MAEESTNVAAQTAPVNNAQTNSTQAPVTETTQNTPAITNTEVKLTNVPNYKVQAQEELDFDKRLYTEDGKFNKDGAKEFVKELKEKEEKYEKRILDLRRKVSDGKAPEKKDEYFQDFAPNEKYMKFFDPAAPSKDEIKKITDKFSETYYNAGLTRRQADDISNTMLETLEELGVMDTRTEEQKYIAKAKWVEDQKRSLGSNADNIIREARMFVERSDYFDAKTKNTMLEMMESIGAPFINTVHQLKDAFGEGAGRVPTNISNLGGLPSDLQLKQEYMNPATSELRRQEIITLRAKAGRSGRLFDAQA